MKMQLKLYDTDNSKKQIKYDPHYANNPLEWLPKVKAVIGIKISIW